MLLALIDLGVFTYYLIDALTDASFDGSSRGSAAMDTSDWIIAGIGLAQAIALGVAAIFAWKAYDAAKREREAARVERQATEGRRILQSVIDETMALAEQVEERVPAVGSQRLDLIMGCQQRLRIALAFLPEPMLPKTRLLTDPEMAPNTIQTNQLEASASELAELARQLAPASFGDE